jgi:predicted aldo/keto reductase-like oxidoreductase
MKTTIHGLDRRAFLKRGLIGLAGAGAAAVPFASARGRQASAAGARKGALITRKLGRTGIVLPVVSMGVMNADNDNLVRSALEAGMVHLDTAHGYQRGRNEEMIGRVLKGRPRESFVIATKVWEDEKFAGLLDLSLKRLGLDHVDILYVHGLGSRKEVLSDLNLRNVEAAKKSGKARFVGVSTHGNEAEVIRAAVEAKAYDVVLTAYNFRKKNLADLEKAIREAAQAGVGIVAMKTQAGAFWDKGRKDPINMTAALKWALNNTDITTAIPGFTTYDQLKTDAAVLTDITLTEGEKKDLRLGVETGGLYCQQCGTCLAQCPRALPIPDLMRGYMYAYGYRNLEAAHDTVASLKLPEDPCRDCSSCSVRCASAFDVRDRVSDIVRIGRMPGDFFV